MKRIVCTPSNEMNQYKTAQKSIVASEYEETINILHNKGYKITFHPSINGVIAWKLNTLRNVVNFIVLNHLGKDMLNLTETDAWIQKILNILRDKPEILLNDLNFRSLGFPLAGKIKIPYVNGSPTQVKVNAIIFNSNLHSSKGDVFFVKRCKEFSKVLKEIESMQRESNYIDLSNVQKTLVRFFMVLSAIWSLAFIFSYLNLLQPVTLTATVFSFAASIFLFTAIKVRKTFTEIKAKLFYLSEDVKLHVQSFAQGDMVSCFNMVVEAFLDKDWLKFDSSAKYLLNMLSNRVDLDMEIYNKINMLNEVLSTDLFLRNGNVHFFVLNELSKILRNLKLVSFDVKEILKEREETETVEENSEKKEISEEIQQPNNFSKNQENGIKSFEASGNEETLPNFEANGSMGIVFHPQISSVNNFLETFERKGEETAVGKGEERR